MWQCRQQRGNKMKVSIRKSTFSSGIEMLKVYRPRERSFTLAGNAQSTKSKFWIVAIPGQPYDVVFNEKEATKRLNDYYSAIGE
jgi:hypothetical protein